MSRMARPFCLPQDEREEEVSVEGGDPIDARRRQREPQEEPDEYDSPDEDTGQDDRYERLEELLFCLYNVFRMALLPPQPLRRRNPNRGSGRGRQQVVSAGDREETGAAASELRGAVPRRRQRVSPAMAEEAAQTHESDGEGDGLLMRERAAEARRRAGRRRLSSRTVATETEEEPPRGTSGNSQLQAPAAAPEGARRSMSTSSTQCSYEDWAEAGEGAGGSSFGGPLGGDGGEEDDGEEEEDDVFVSSRSGNENTFSRPPSPPPPPSSNSSGRGNSRPSGGGNGSLQSRRQRRKRSGGGSSSSSGSGGRQRKEAKTEEEKEEQTVCSQATPVSDDVDGKMAAPRKAEVLWREKSIEDWNAVSRELRDLTLKYSHFKQIDEKVPKRKKSKADKAGSITSILSPLLPTASPGIWTLVAVCVGAKVIRRLW